MKRLVKIIPRLAVADLRHEWILTLCLVLAVAAVVSPLLILMGLKHGTISTLKNRLVDDPVYREIRPAETQEYNSAWFDKLAKDPRVGFLLPTILPASSIIQVIDPETGNPILFDLIPTAENDPLLVENNIPVVAKNSCVLSYSAAKKLGAETGEDIQLRASRSRSGKTEYGTETFRVAGVLPLAATTLPRVYAPLQFVLDVERYKEGMAIGNRNWSGKVPEPYASYNGVLVLKEGEIPALVRNALLIESGLADIREVDGNEVNQLIGLILPENWKAWRLSIPRGHITHPSYKAVKQKLRGHNALVIPFVAPLSVAIDGEPLTVVGQSVSKRYAEKLGLESSPWGGLKRNPRSKDLLEIMLPKQLDKPTGSKVEIGFTGKKHMTFPAIVVAHHDQVRGVLPVELTAMLETAGNRVVDFDHQQGSLRMSQAGFRGFRLYAKTIDDVPSLAEYLQNQDVAVVAEIDAIKRIQILDAGLTRLFWLIAVLGVAGGIAVLAASLYASVERKGKDLAMLRLSGLSRLDLFAMPVYEGQLIAIGGVVLASISYLLMASVINLVFAQELGSGEKICTLPPQYFLAGFGVTMAVAMFSSFTAAWKATRIDPADAIRAE